MKDFERADWDALVPILESLDDSDLDSLGAGIESALAQSAARRAALESAYAALKEVVGGGCDRLEDAIREVLVTIQKSAPQTGVFLADSPHHLVEHYGGKNVAGSS